MTPSLERLAEMVRQAETKSRAQKLGAETQKAAERLKLAEERAQVADRRLRDDRPAREREVEQCGTDEVRLKELVRKIAGLIAAGNLGADSGKSYEKEIEASRAEIDTKRKHAQAEL